LGRLDVATSTHAGWNVFCFINDRALACSVTVGLSDEIVWREEWNDTGQCKEETSWSSAISISWGI